MPSIVHIEIASSDPKTAGEFYKNLFGWNIEVDQRFDYVQFTPPEGVAGAFPQADADMYKPGDVIVYVGTDNIEAAQQKVEALGGKVLVPKTEIPGMGWFAIIADPTGARMGLYTGGG